MRKAVGLVLAGLLAPDRPSAPAEPCKVAWTDSAGAPRYTPIDVDLAGKARLDPAALPDRASAIMCLRRSLVPRPEDYRVLSEWRLPFGIAEEKGQRALWISARAGRLEVKVDGGKLSTAERAAVRQWIAPANIRFVLEWGRPGQE